jgi:molybdopterin converting factor small subunit
MAEIAKPVTVEFYGWPRWRAGRTELTVPAGTVEELLAAVERACPGLAGLQRTDGGLAPYYLLSRDGRQFVADSTQEVQPGERLLLLSADAGG